MKFGFSKMQIAIITMFLFAFISIMLTYVSTISVFFTLAFLVAGFVLLSVVLIKNYNKFKLEQEHKKEELLMELSVTDEGEKYVLKDNPYSKSESREQKARKIDKLIPVVLSISASVLFLYLLIMQFLSI